MDQIRTEFTFTYFYFKYEYIQFVKETFRDENIFLIEIVKKQGCINRSLKMTSICKKNMTYLYHLTLW